jgi:hypothetical protein
LTPLDGTPVDSCAFRFRGQGLIVSGERGPFVATPDDVSDEQDYAKSSSSDSVVRFRYRHDKTLVQSAYLPELSRLEPALLSVQYSDPLLEESIAGIVSSVRRCETQVQ